MQFFLFIALILVLALVLFAVQNSAEVSLTFLKWTFEGSLAFLMALTFAVGMLTGIFLSIPTWWRKSKQNRAQKKRINELEKEVLNMVEQERASEFDEPGEERF